MRRCVRCVHHAYKKACWDVSRGHPAQLNAPAHKRALIFQSYVDATLRQRVLSTLVVATNVSVLRFGMAVLKSIGVLATIFVLLASSLTQAESDDVLYDMLRKSSSFKVRAGAALTLGHSNDPRHAVMLEQALRDYHSAVRSAAANALGHLGVPRSLPALERATHDLSPSVAQQARASIALIRGKRHSSPTALAKGSSSAQASTRIPHARLAIVVGTVDNSSGFMGDDVREPLRNALAQALRSQRGVIVLDPRASGPTLDSVRQQHLPVLRVDANLLSIKSSEVHGRIQVRCEVTLMLLDEGERTLRSVLRGAASAVAAPHGPRASQERLMARAAATNAVRSALSHASGALSDAAQRASVGNVSAQGIYATR